MFDYKIYIDSPLDYNLKYFYLIRTFFKTFFLVMVQKFLEQNTKSFLRHFFFLSQRRKYAHSRAHQKLHKYHLEFFLTDLRYPIIFSKKVENFVIFGLKKLHFRVRHFLTFSQRRKYAHSRARQKVQISFFLFEEWTSATQNFFTKVSKILDFFRKIPTKNFFFKNESTSRSNFKKINYGSPPDSGLKFRYRRSDLLSQKKFDLWALTLENKIYSQLVPKFWNFSFTIFPKFFL